MRLSIVIPCYKVEKYIRRCLDSVLNINLPLSEYEVICFDDKSPDTTSAILDEYANACCNVRIIHSNANVGPGGGRNRASQIAQGKYIWFVDADDMIIPDNVPTLIMQAEENMLDVLVFDYQDIDEDEHPIKKGYDMKDTEVMNGCEIGNLAFEGGLVNNMGYPVRFLLARDYLTKHEISFPEWMTYGEDTVWMAKVVLFAERIQASSVCAYKYWHHETSTCGQLNSVYPGKTIYERCVLTAMQLINFVQLLKEKGNNWTQYAKEIERHTISHYVNQLPILMSRTTTKERIVFYKQYRKIEYVNIRQIANGLTKLITIPFIGLILTQTMACVYKMKH